MQFATKKIAFIVFLCAFCHIETNAQQSSGSVAIQPVNQRVLPSCHEVLTGADQLSRFIPGLKGLRVAAVVNHTSVVHRPDGSLCPLADTLLSSGVNLRCLMAPEHGYKGSADAGEHVANTQLAQLPIYSLYGKNKKPQAEWLKDIDMVIFDLQDVGTRFYTYTSTLYYVLQACGEQGIDVMVLDRPNPNDTIDGPMRDDTHASFVGIIPIPLLHGCTLGELAEMMLGQRWTNAPAPNLTIIRCEGWKHGQPYSLPVPPSPNLPCDQAIALYPSLCLFEGTDVSVGRGTDFPFQVYGHPAMKGDFNFTPQSSAGAKNPLQMNHKCIGQDLRTITPPRGFSLRFLIDAESQLNNQCITQAKFFDLLAGNALLRQQLIEQMSEEEIRKTWQAELSQYKKMRKHFLLYEE